MNVDETGGGKQSIIEKARAELRGVQKVEHGCGNQNSKLWFNSRNVVQEFRAACRIYGYDAEAEGQIRVATLPPPNGQYPPR